MKVPTLTGPRTQPPSTVQRVYQSASNTINEQGQMLGRALTQLGGVFEQRRKEQEKFNVSKLAIEESMNTQQILHQQQQEAPLGAEGFTERVLGNLDERHRSLLAGMREQGFSEDAIADMDLRMTQVRQGVLGRALSFQDQSYRAKITSDMEEVGTNLTQIAAMSPYDVDVAVEEFETTLEEVAGLNAVDKEAIRVRGEQSIRIAAGMGLAQQDPRAVVDALAPAGAGDFRERLRTRESSGNPAVVNSLGYAGLYQFGAPRLQTLGIYTPGPGEKMKGWSKSKRDAPGKWSGTFNIPGHPDVTTLQDFLANPAAQEAAMDIHTAEMDREIKELGLEQFIGTDVRGAPLTREGMYAMIHLGGAAGARRALTGRDTSDAYGTSILDYARLGLGSSAMPLDGKTGNPVLDGLSAQGRLQVLGHARTALNQQQAMARAGYENMLTNANTAYLTEGEYTGPLPTREQLHDVYDPFTAENKWEQLTSAQEVGQFIVGMTTQSEAEINAAVAGMRPTDTASPTYAEEVRGWETAQKAAAAVIKQRNDDPANYVLTHYPQVAEAWTNPSPEGRAAAFSQMAEVYEQLGILPEDRVPMPTKVLEGVKSQYNAASPHGRMEMLTSWRQEMGSLYPQGLQQLADSGMPMEAYLSGLIVESPAHEMVAANVLRGVELMTDKSLVPPQKDLDKAYREFLGGDTQRKLGGQVSKAINDAATALYVYNGGSPDAFDEIVFEDAVRQVLGGLPGNEETGIVDLRPRNLGGWGWRTGEASKTILPPGITATEFENWKDGLIEEDLLDLSVTKELPMYGSGTLATPQEIVDEGVFIKVSPGRYLIQMSSDGGYLYDSAGFPYVMELTSDLFGGDVSIGPLEIQ